MTKTKARPKILRRKEMNQHACPMCGSIAFSWATKPEHSIRDFITKSRKCRKCASEWTHTFKIVKTELHFDGTRYS